MKQMQWYFVALDGTIRKAIKRKGHFAVMIPVRGGDEFTICFPLEERNIFYNNYWKAWAESCRRKAIL